MQIIFNKNNTETTTRGKKNKNMKKGNMYKGQEKMLRTHAAGVGKKRQLSKGL